MVTVAKQIFSLLLFVDFLNFSFVISEEEVHSECVKRQNGVERSLLLLKPDALKRGLAGESIKRLENRCPSCKLLAMKVVLPKETQIHVHYADMKNEMWFTEMVDFMTSGLVIPMVWEGENMVAVGREVLHGIRNDFATDRVVVGHLLNIIHGADTVEAAQREMKLWFTEQELIDMEKESPSANKFWPAEGTCLSKANNKSDKTF